MSTQGIQERIKETLTIRRKRPWYKRAWGRLLIFFCVLVVIGLIIFSFMVKHEYDALLSGLQPLTGNISTEAGKVTLDEFTTNFTHEALVDLLQNSGDPSQGPANAKVTIVAFEDFQCPYTAEAQPFIKKILATYGKDVRFIFKNFPLTTIHPRAQSAAEAAMCASDQGKFWQFQDELFSHQDRLADAYYRTVAKDLNLNITQYNECINTGKYKKRIADSVQLGRVLGIQGTPTFFINGELFAQGYNKALDPTFQQAIEYIKGL